MIKRPLTIKIPKCLFTSALVFFAAACGPHARALADVLESPLASSASPQEAFQEAMVLKAEGRLVEAEGKLAEALQSEPGNPAYHFELANLYALQHDAYQEISRDRSGALLGRVAHELDQTLMLDPDFLPAQYNLAVTYKRLGEYERAREELRRLITKAEKKNDLAMKRNAVMQIGLVYQEQGFFEEARDYFLQAREMDYGNLDAQDALENLKQHQQWKEANTRKQDMGRSLSAMQQSLSQVSANSRSGSGQSSVSNPYGYSDPRSTAGSQQQMIASLGSMLAQQFLSRGNSESR